MKTKLKAILFDLDGTLLNTLEDLHNSVNFALSCMDFEEQSLEQTRRGVGNGIPALLEHALPKHAQGRLMEALSLFLPHYEAHMGDATAPYPGILALLATLRERGIRTAVITNKDEGPAQALCEAYFPGLLDLVAGAVAERPRKPAPDSVYSVMDTFGLNAREAVYIGDSETDIRTAQNAGVRFIGVSWGFREREALLREGAALVVENAEELLDYMEL